MLYDYTIPAAIRALTQLNACLDKAAAFADAKKVEFPVLLSSRLIADQLPMVRQIQIACDTAKFGASRLTGKDAPANDDKEATLAEAKARIDSTIAYLNTFKPEDFKGAEERKVTTPRWEGKWLTGLEYAQHHVLPNLYFHVTTAYAILRSNGVDIGKKDYLGAMPYKN
jgi:uncharacterized protein